MTIDELRDRVMQLKPANFMAMNGAASGILGSFDSGTNAVLQLQRATIEFADRYKTGNEDETMDARREVTAKIMVALTFDAISQAEADELIEALGQLMKGRE